MNTGDVVRQLTVTKEQVVAEGYYKQLSPNEQQALYFSKLCVSFGQAEANGHTQRDWHQLKGEELEVYIVNSHDPPHDVHPNDKSAEDIERNHQVLQSALYLLPLVLIEGRAHFWVFDL